MNDIKQQIIMNDVTLKIREAQTLDEVKELALKYTAKYQTGLTEYIDDSTTVNIKYLIDCHNYDLDEALGEFLDFQACDSCNLNDLVMDILDENNVTFLAPYIDFEKYINDLRVEYDEYEFDGKTYIIRLY